MDYLQYQEHEVLSASYLKCFKPCYKWITFNTTVTLSNKNYRKGFKPCYKWITFNTKKTVSQAQIDMFKVLNLVINGLPSILLATCISISSITLVLNLVINGLPSILILQLILNQIIQRFKPCYKWITFNTITKSRNPQYLRKVLNLVINGLPSIHNGTGKSTLASELSFKPCYKWITFNTIQIY